MGPEFSDRDILIQVRTMVDSIQRELAEFKTDVKGELDKLDSRVASLEERRFPWAVISGVVALLSLAAAVYATVKP